MSIYAIQQYHKELEKIIHCVGTIETNMGKIEIGKIASNSHRNDRLGEFEHSKS